MDRDTIYQLGLQKLAELDSKVKKLSLSPEQVAEKIAKVASIENMDGTDTTINTKLACAIFDSASKGDRDTTIALLGYYQ